MENQAACVHFPLLSQLQQAVDASGEVIFITDRRGRFTFVNREFERLYGYAAADVVGRATPRILKSGRTSPEMYASIWRRLLAGEVVHWESVNRTKDGTLVHVEASANPIRDERHDVVGFLAIQRDVTARHLAEVALRDSETRYRTLAEAAHDSIFIVNRTSQIEYANDVSAARFGRTSYEIMGRRLDEVFPGDTAAEMWRELSTVFATGKRQLFEQRFESPTGELWLETWVVPLGGQGAEPDSVMGVARDVTGRKLLERQLIQSQKMEAVGRLAGGVAHDFNNLLTAIQGYTELVIDTFDAGDRRRQDLDEVRRAAQSAATLTRQLLTFSRKSICNPTVLDVNAVIRQFERIVRRTIGEDIDVSLRLDQAVGRVTMDAAHLEQILMNLSVNARDAMPRGGVLTIATTDLVAARHAKATPRSVPPGHYVVLSITDTGTGMSADVQSHLFEPFYTTKGLGKGTGLGLSTVHGIVTQNGGSIGVVSAVDRGTTFTIHLPCTERPTAAGDEEGPVQSRPAGCETILIAEDHDGLRSLVSRTLESCGYRTLTAKDAPEALRMSDDHAGPIHLLLTDVVMPGADGLELSRAVMEQRLETRVLYMSGHTEDLISHHGLLDRGVAFLQKPFSGDRLAHKVREVLQATGASGR